MKALLGVCFFLGLLSPAALLQCYDCVGQECETPRIVNCRSDQNVCFLAATELKLGEFVPSLVVQYKHCGKTKECLKNELIMHTGGNESFYSRTACCCSDRCNERDLSLPELYKDRPNGKKCPSCFTFDSTECTETEKMTCTGPETKCIEGVMEMETSFLEAPLNLTFQGCGTPNMCNAKFLMAPVILDENKFTMKQLQCING